MGEIMKSNTSRFFVGLGLLLYLILYSTSLDHSFFWDTIQLGSSHAHFFYENNFSKILLPEPIDSGHIPLFGAYLALTWKFFGQTLLVSHLAMLPFVLGIGYQVIRLPQDYFGNQQWGIVSFLLLIDPTLMAQITMVSPDVLLIFFFLLSLRAILKNHKSWIIVGMLFLFLVSLRGIMIAFCLFLFDMYRNVDFRQNTQRILEAMIRRGFLYVPATLLAGSYLFYHYDQRGWIGYHEDSVWYNCFQRVGFQGFLRNIGIYFWRLWDFGRVGIWAIGIWLAIRNWSRWIGNKRLKPWVLLFFIFACVLPLNMLWANNLLGHRYLLPIYLCFSLLVAFLLFSSPLKPKIRRVLILFWALILLSGNIWVYPRHISQGWDSSLAYLPYNSLRKEAMAFLDDQNIPTTAVGSFFPNISSMKWTDLSKTEDRFRSFSLENKPEYVFYSNVFNLSDVHRKELEKNYTEYKNFRSTSVIVIIFQRTSN